MRKPAIVLAALMAASPVCLAQEPETPAPAGAVVKDKAPVARELLKVRFPRPRTFKLKNGVTVYLLEDHRFPVIRLSLEMRAGSIWEPKPGVADMTASMLTEGAGDKDYLRIADETESMGASIGANAGDTETTLGISGLVEDLDALVALMAEVLLKPTFPQDRLDRAKYQQTSMLAMRRSNPASSLRDASARVFYGDTVFGRASTTAEQIRAITREDLVAFHQASFKPNGARIGVTGDVSVRVLKAKLEAALAQWQAGGAAPEVPKSSIPAKDATRVYVCDRPSSTQSNIMIGNISITRTHPDYVPLVVANHILGGGSAGRLFQNIREQKGYTYGAYSSVTAGLWPGTWTASASVRTAVTAPAIVEFLREFQRLQDEPVTQAELDRTKRAIVGSFARTLENSEGMLSRAMDLVQYGLPSNYWDTYPKLVEAVTTSDVQRVARQYLSKGRAQIFVVGERKEIEDSLKQFGPVEIVEPQRTGGAG
jgi:predicted Zn-dependent peptidase